MLSGCCRCWPTPGPTWRPDRRARSLASGTSSAAAVPPSDFQAWFAQLMPSCGRRAGALSRRPLSGRFSYPRFVTNVLTAGSGGATMSSTPASETCDQASPGVRAGLADMVQRMGPDMNTWRWDTVHHAVFPHQGLDSVGFLRPLISRTVPSAGDWSTVNVGPVAWRPLRSGVDSRLPADRRSLPCQRQPLCRCSRQSGHFLSPHYDDFLRTGGRASQENAEWTARTSTRARSALRLVPR